MCDRAWTFAGVAPVATHDIVISLTMDGIITYWNHGAEELHGWPRAEALGKVTRDLLKTRFPEPREEIYVRLLQLGRYEGEFVSKRRDGTPVTVASRWSLQRDRCGRPTAILVTSNDITERKRAEQATAALLP